MSAQDLRSHLRLQTESRALLHLSDGSRVRCVVHDISMGGAYLVRSSEYGPPAEVPPTGPVKVYIFHPGSGDGFTLDAEIVRVEAGGGAGIALRFSIYDDTSRPLVELVHKAADKAGVSRGALGVPIIRTREQRRWAPQQALLRRSGVAAAVIFGIWTLRIAQDWLEVNF